MERGIEGGFNFLSAIMGTETCSEMNRTLEHFEIMNLVPKDDFFVTFLDMPFKVTENTGRNVTIDVLGVPCTKKAEGSRLQPGGEVKIVARPESLSLGRTGDIPCKVVSSIFMGESQDYVVNACGKDLKVKVYNPLIHETYHEGEDIFLSLQKDSLHMIPKKD